MFFFRSGFFHLFLTTPGYNEQVKMEEATPTTGGCPWATLPDELCTHLFSLLDVPDLCTATRVCKAPPNDPHQRVPCLY